MKWSRKLRIIIARTKKSDIQLFVLFLLISTLVWFIEKMKQNYTVTVEFPIECINVPDGYRVKKEQVQPMKVMLTSDGSTIFWNYSVRRPPVIAVDISRLRVKMNENETWVAFVPHAIENHLQSRLPESVNMKGILNDTITVPLLTVKKKYLPVRVQGSVTLSPQHIQSRPMNVEPERVWVNGTNDIIDTMTAVYTKRIESTTLVDTLTTTLPYLLPKGVEASATESTVTYYVETFTEKKIDVPITAINVPAGYNFKAFPNTVKVTFNVGLSKFETISATNFDIVADLENVEVGNQNSKIKLTLRNSPVEVQNITFSPRFVEFLLEKN